MGKTSKVKTENSVEKTIKESAEELLSKMQIVAAVQVVLQEGSKEEEKGEVYEVNVETEESGLLIGFHGETLSALQIILGLIVFRKLGKWVRVVVEIGDYRAKRAEQLAAMAESYAAQALATGQAVVFPPLSPAERRVIHMTLGERDDVESVSEGEGRDRRITVKPKAS